MGLQVTAVYQMEHRGGTCEDSAPFVFDFMRLI